MSPKYSNGQVDICHSMSLTKDCCWYFVDKNCQSGGNGCNVLARPSASHEESSHPKGLCSVLHSKLLFETVQFMVAKTINKT